MHLQDKRPKILIKPLTGVRQYAKYQSSRVDKDKQVVSGSFCSAGGEGGGGQQVSRVSRGQCWEPRGVLEGDSGSSSEKLF